MTERQAELMIELLQSILTVLTESKDKLEAIEGEIQELYGLTDKRTR